MAGILRIPPLPPLDILNGVTKGLDKTKVIFISFAKRRPPVCPIPPTRVLSSFGMSPTQGLRNRLMADLLFLGCRVPRRLR